LNEASAAAALQVTKPGAADAIPQRHEVLAFIESQT
jgi:sugar/nucleoside kinase (ribokinase family)